jgi:5-methylcytosine-specific restriction endonuclease McrA
MERSGPLARKPMKRRRAPDSQIPQAVRDAVERRSGGKCEIEHPGCTVKATEMHHRLSRSAGGGHQAVNILNLCRVAHHDWVHGQPRLAYQHGWLVRRGGDPAVVAVTMPAV